MQFPETLINEASVLHKFRLLPLSEPAIAAEAGNEAVIIRVRDQGPGIPEEEQPRLFDKFYRSLS